MKSAIIALIAAASLSACAGDASKAPIVSKRLILPDIVEYQPAVRNAAADEIEGGSCPVLSDVFMPDYGVMRDQTRAAKKGLK